VLQTALGRKNFPLNAAYCITKAVAGSKESENLPKNDGGRIHALSHSSDTSRKHALYQALKRQYMFQASTEHTWPTQNTHSPNYGHEASASDPL